jgi:hypothetical protein
LNLGKNGREGRKEGNCDCEGAHSNHKWQMNERGNDFGKRLREKEEEGEGM